MGIGGEEVELLSSDGLNADSLDKGAFYQNLVWRQGAWWTRLGFGQMCQFDSTLSFPKSGTGDYGYERQLGSYAMTTDFGHVHIVTLLRGVMFTGNEVVLGEWRDSFALSVYDVTTDRRWEVILHRHTSQSLGSTWEMPRWRGVYESALDLPLDGWSATQLNKTAWFNEYEGVLFFGAEGLGTHVYRPATFYDVRRQQLDGARENDWSKGYSESSLVSPVGPSDGVFSDGYAYLGVDAFPSATDMTTFGDRVVYVSGREVFYSDKLRPQAVMGRNIDFVPMKEEIVAVEALHGVIYVFSRSEVRLIQPDLSGAVVAGGRQILLASDVGALSSRCVLSVGGVLFWVDGQGTYMCPGDMTYKKISDGVDPLFESILSNPMTSYFAEGGWSPLALSQPRLTYSIKESADAHLAYDPVEELLFLVLPEQNCAFVNQDGSWVLWNFESVSNNNDPSAVESKRGVVNPWIVTADRGVYLVGGVEVYSVPDVTVVGGDGSPLHLDAQSGSYYILSLGRGGGLDRSVSAVEDRRLMNGRYLGFNRSVPPSRGYFYINEPTKMPDQYELPVNPTKQDGLYLFPVTAVHQADGIVAASLHIGYDNNQWEPVYVNGVDLQIDLVFPPEREPSKAGWGTIAQSPTHQARTWDGAAYARGGNEFHFDFSGADGLVDDPGGWTTAPTMNAPAWSEVPLFWIPMRKKIAGNNVMGMGWTSALASMTAEGEALLDQNVYAWQFSDAGSRYFDDEPAQPVDWVFKSSQVSFPARSHKARGLRMFVMSHVASSAPLFPNWIHGLLNIVLATDYRGWVSQIVDYRGDIEGVRLISKHRTIRSRLKDSAGAMKQKVFGSDSKWGDKSSNEPGNVLIGDEEWNEISVSDRGRGESSTWMLFGHIRSRAERISLNSVIGLYRKLGSIRRRGR